MLAGVLSIGVLVGCGQNDVNTSSKGNELQPVIIQGAMDVANRKVGCST